MKKILAIGDLHGSDIWKDKLTDITIYERIIFLGDYVDHWTRSDKDILNNLLDIIQLKKDYPDKVITLLGNHDYYYLIRKFGCSGLRPTMMEKLHEIFTENKKMFLICYQIESDDVQFLFSHAGIHQQYYSNFIDPITCVLDGIDKRIISLADKACNRLAPKINLLHFNYEYRYIYSAGRDRGGLELYGGPLWIDMNTLIKNPLREFKVNGNEYKKIIQIVGHTEQKKKVNNQNNIVFVDFPSYPFYEMEIPDNYSEFL